MAAQSVARSGLSLALAAAVVAVAAAEQASSRGLLARLDTDPATQSMYDAQRKNPQDNLSNYNGGIKLSGYGGDSYWKAVAWLGAPAWIIALFLLLCAVVHAVYRCTVAGRTRAPGAPWRLCELGPGFTRPVRIQSKIAHWILLVMMLAAAILVGIGRTRFQPTMQSMMDYAAYVQAQNVFDIASASTSSYSSYNTISVISSYNAVAAYNPGTTNGAALLAAVQYSMNVTTTTRMQLNDIFLQADKGFLAIYVCFIVATGIGMVLSAVTVDSPALRVGLIWLYSFAVPVAVLCWVCWGAAYALGGFTQDFCRMAANYQVYAATTGFSSVLAATGTYGPSFTQMVQCASEPTTAAALVAHAAAIDTMVAGTAWGTANQPCSYLLTSTATCTAGTIFFGTLAQRTAAIAYYSAQGYSAATLARITALGDLISTYQIVRDEAACMPTLAVAKAFTSDVDKCDTLYDGTKLCFNGFVVAAVALTLICVAYLFEYYYAVPLDAALPTSALNSMPVDNEGNIKYAVQYPSVQLQPYPGPIYAEQQQGPYAAPMYAEGPPMYAPEPYPPGPRYV